MLENRLVVVLTLVPALVACAACGNRKPAAETSSTAFTQTASGIPGAQAEAPCTFPTTVAPVVEETAWRLFIAATCPVNRDKYPYVVWQNWVEQADLFGDKALLAAEVGKRPKLHASFLAKMLANGNRFTVEMANQDCDTRPSGRTICEEVRQSPATAAYIRDTPLLTKAQEEAFVGAHRAFAFPGPSIEIKVDWIQLATCDAPPVGVHVERIADSCYALAGMHFISKLIDKWIWATFEPQNSVTNPKRCRVLGCLDPWGSSPAKVAPGTEDPQTAQTAALAELMKAANLAPEWANYRLDGVQVDYLAADGSPTLLGNSIIEGENVGGDLTKSSCITCHAASAIDPQGNQGQPGFIVGIPLLPSGFVRRDFVWAFMLAK